jgi:hypothetical protein
MCEIKRQDASHKWQHPANTFKLKSPVFEFVIAIKRLHFFDT